MTHPEDTTKASPLALSLHNRLGPARDAVMAAVNATLAAQVAHDEALDNYQLGEWGWHGRHLRQACDDAALAADLAWDALAAETVDAKVERLLLALRTIKAGAGSAEFVYQIARDVLAEFEA